MDEINENINKKNSILLARNNPVALVVGAASFLGSHLVDKLLDKNIQVIGVDDLGHGEKKNLRHASENRNFHMVIENLEKLDLDLERLDYIFIIPQKAMVLGKILEFFKEKKSRILLLSSIELYDKSTRSLGWLKEIEEKLAEFAGDNNLNARILRLGPVFGPRMSFDNPDPLMRLIHQALISNLQKEVSLEFSSRALYVEDAVDLAIKTILSGATAQKIFDGVLPTPIKVSEIKQVLLDPVWYENRDFSATALPPWPTPNLQKTIDFLNWHPKNKLIASLRKTLNYFKDNEIQVPQFDDGRLKIEDGKKEELESFKQGNEKRVEIPKINEKKNKGVKFPGFLSKVYLVLVLGLIGYAIIWPGLILGWGLMSFRNNLSSGLNNLGKGDFENSLINIKQADEGLSQVESIFDSMAPIRQTGFLKEQFEMEDNFLSLAKLSLTSSENTILGVQALFQSMKAVTGELNESPQGYFDAAQIDLASASEDISRAYAFLGSMGQVSGISDKLGLYKNLLQKAHTLSLLLPKLVAMNGSKSYLILLQNNMELRPTGGFIGSFAKISFEGGKLKKLDVNDIYAIDEQLAIHVEPPKEIVKDLGQKDWFLRDSNWEPDFPTAARQAQWFYTKETGERVEGTIALDISAIEGLLSVVGPLNLSDYNETITSDNLFAKIVSHDQKFLTALASQLFNKIFFLPKQNWAGIVSALGKALDEKHLSIYLDDTKLFSYLTTEGWTQTMPRESEQNRNNDFLSVVEANLGANKANYYLDRGYKMETVIGKDGQVSHRLRISYTNRSPSDTFPGGAYKNRLRVYLPFGSKLARALWSESDITKDVTSFVDYGRSGYSMLLELAPKEQKTLVLDYSVPLKLEFKNKQASYRLDIVKQAGILKDPMEWSISYPIGYQVVSNQAKKIAPQEQTIQTDLSKDRSFKVEFKD